MEGQEARPMHDERGMALATVIISLVVVGALVTTMLMMGMQEQRMGESSRWLNKSFGVTEGGVGEILASWNAGANNLTVKYPAATITVASTPASAGKGVYGGSVLKLTDQIYLFDVTGRDSTTIKGQTRGDGARQRVGMFTRVMPLQVDVQAAMTIGAPVNFGGGNVFIRGADNTPPGYTGCATPDPIGVNGVRAKNAGDAVNSNGQMTATPPKQPVQITPTMDSTTFTQFGPTSYSQLASAATIALAGGSTYNPLPNPNAAVGVCNNASSNWGDPTNPTWPCANRFPVIHITGAATNTTIGTGRGQGILLVDGDLTISGAFTFYGLIIIKGKMTTTAGGSPTIYGSLLVQSMNFATTAFAGAANIYYSKCALQRTRDAVGNPNQLRSRGWVELM